MEITKEYLDKQFKNNLKLTKEYIDEKLDQKLDEKLKNVATKDDLTELETRMGEKFATKVDLKDSLKAQTVELKGYVHESFETQQVYMDERFKELIDGIQIRVNFPGLKAKSHKVR